MCWTKRPKRVLGVTVAVPAPLVRNVTAVGLTASKRLLEMPTRWV